MSRARADPPSLVGEVRETFRQAALQREAERGLKSHDWKTYRLIGEACATRRSDETRDFRSAYDLRLEIARKWLIDQAGDRKGPSLVLRWFGRDGFDPDEIERQAHRLVQGDHQRTLSRMDADRDRRIDSLLDEVDRRRRLSGKLEAGFEKATDRRSGIERRKGPQR